MVGEAVGVSACVYRWLWLAATWGMNCYLGVLGPRQDNSEACEGICNVLSDWTQPSTNPAFSEADASVNASQAAPS